MTEKADRALWIAERVEKDVADHEDRIRGLEMFMAKIMGMAALGGIIGGVIAAVIQIIAK